MFIGAVVITLGSISFTFMVESFGQYLIYLSVAIQGIGLAILLNTATSIISDVIGDDKKSSAFVFGVYSFFDKISSGILLFIITNYLISKPFWLRAIAGVLPIVAGFSAFGLCALG